MYNLYNLIFAFIIAIASFLRFYHLGENPVALNQDEAVNGYDAYSLMMTMRDHHGNFMPVMLESFGDWASPAITYLTIPFVKLLGLSELSVRLPVALLGIGTVILVYFFILEILKSRKLALIGAFLLAIMPWHIVVSRWAIPPSIVPFFTMLFMVMGFWIIKEQKIALYKLFLLAVCAGIITYSYPTQKMVVPLIIFAFGLIYLFKKWIELAILWVSYGIIVAPIYLLSFIDPNKYNARFKVVSILKEGDSIFNIAKNFLVRYIKYLSPDFYFGFGDRNIMHHIPGFGSNYEFLTIFFYVGILTCFYILINKNSLTFEHHYINKKLCLFLLLWLFIAPLPASLTKEYNHVLRMVHGFTASIIFIVLGISVLTLAINNHKINQILLTVIVVVSLLNVISFSHVYFREYPEQSKGDFQYGIKEFMNYSITNQDRFRKIVIDTKINQPYIYYLFYSEYDPRLIDYTQIEPYDRVKILDKYEFRKLNEKELIFAKEVYRVSDQNRVWYVLYEQPDHVLIVQKQ